MIVTTGGLSTKSSALSSISKLSKFAISAVSSFFNTLSYSETITSAESKSTDWFIPAITPNPINFLTNSTGATLSKLANSVTVIPSLYRTTLSSCVASLLCNFSLCLYNFFLSFKKSFLLFSVFLGWLFFFTFVNDSVLSKSILVL